jgi:hypothetical protein
MLKNIFKKKLTVAEARDKVAQLELLESYHWQRSSYHYGMHGTITKRRRHAKSELREAEQAFIKASMEE